MKNKENYFQHTSSDWPFLTASSSSSLSRACTICVDCVHQRFSLGESWVKIYNVKVGVQTAPKILSKSKIHLESFEGTPMVMLSQFHQKVLKKSTAWNIQVHTGQNDFPRVKKSVRPLFQAGVLPSRGEPSSNLAPPHSGPLQNDPPSAELGSGLAIRYFQVRYFQVSLAFH